MKKLKSFLVLLLCAISISGITHTATAATITLDPTTDLGVWQYFSFGDVGSYAENTYEFTTTETLSFFVTDAYAIGDRFEIFDSTTSLGLTSFVAVSGAHNISDAQTAYDSGYFSTGEFVVSAGTYSMNILTSISPYGSGGAFVKLDNSSTSPVPEPVTMILFGIGLLGLAGVNRKKAIAA